MVFYCGFLFSVFYVFFFILEILFKRYWSVDEEVVVKCGVSKFGVGSWKEIKEGDLIFVN